MNEKRRAYKISLDKKGQVPNTEKEGTLLSETYIFKNCHEISSLILDLTCDFWFREKAKEEELCHILQV